MPAARDTISHWAFKVGGADLSEPIMDSLISAEVDDSLDLPDMFVIHVRDPRLDFLETGPFALGAPVEISVKTDTGFVKLMTGEITALEPTFVQHAPTLLVRGYDLSHRLHHGRKTRSFVNKTDSDIAREVARKAGLRNFQIDPTSEVYDWVLQNNQTDFEFLQQRACRIGYRLFVEADKFHFVRSLANTAPPPSLEYGIQLTEFRARQSTAEQVIEVFVRSWDAKTKKPILGHASKPTGLPQVGQSALGGQAVQQAYGCAPQQIVVDRPVATKAEADALAQSICDELGAAYIQAEGLCQGNPAVLAGGKVNLSGLGNKFSGSYLVTHSRHRYEAHKYSTRFTVSTQREATLAQILGMKPNGAVRSGVVVGIVTDNNDPKAWGRVKVKYPWQDDTLVSDWARVITPMAGDGRGIQFPPEVNDEVLLSFEHGDMHRPFVLGALWNGVDSPPEKSNQIISGGKVNKRLIKSRIGHTIILDDTNNTGGITIIDKTNNNKVTIDTKKNKITIEAQGDIEITALTGNLSMSATKKVTIEGKQGVDIKGAKINLN